MKRNIKIFSNIVLFSIIISFFNFPAYISLAVNEAYYNTPGQEFIRTLVNDKAESNIRENLPYNLSFIYKNRKINLESKVLYKSNTLYISWISKKYL